MTTRAIKWADWRRSIESRCDYLSRSFGGVDSAVRLDQITEQSGVKRVEFRPLLVEGGLSIQGDGFVMYVNCSKDQISQLNDEFVCNGGRSLPNRMRFTIAHELIHTFFFELSSDAPRNRVKVTSDKDHDQLERLCDFGAGLLLMPSRRIGPLLDREPQISPDSLRRLAQHFAVSLDALLIRLNGMSWGNHRGFAALIVEDGQTFKIRASATDSTSKHLFSTVQTNNTLGQEILESLQTCRGSQDAVVYEYPCHIGQKEAVQPCVVMCDRITHEPSKFVLSIQLSGDPKFESATTIPGDIRRSM